jgi:hypothetical protein
MNAQKTQETVGALAPQKTRVFSTEVSKNGVRITAVESAPQQEQLDVRRVRAD